MDEIYRFMPSEIICNESYYMSGMDLDDLKDRLGITIYSLDSWYFDDAVCRQDVYKRQPGRNAFRVRYAGTSNGRTNLKSLQTF